MLCGHADFRGSWKHFRQHIFVYAARNVFDKQGRAILISTSILRLFLFICKIKISCLFTYLRSTLHRFTPFKLCYCSYSSIMYSFYNVYSYLPLRYMDLDTVNSLKLFTLLEVNYYYTFTFLRLLFLDWFLFFFFLLLCKNTFATFEVILMTLHKKYHLSFLF